MTCLEPRQISQTAPAPRSPDTMPDIAAIHDLVARLDDAVNRRDKDEFSKYGRTTLPGRSATHVRFTSREPTRS